MSNTDKLYLGDSVYVELDEAGRLVLTTNNGYPDDPRNRIVMESDVYRALVVYVNELASGTATSNPQARFQHLLWRYHNDPHFHVFVERMCEAALAAYKEHHLK